MNQKKVLYHLAAAFLDAIHYHVRREGWGAPEPETLEQEYMACYQAMQKHKKKTA